MVGLYDNINAKRERIRSTQITSTGTTSGGEVVYNAPLPVGGLQTYDLTAFFPLYTTVQGNMPDMLTIAITNTSGSAVAVGASLIAQEAMS